MASAEAPLPNMDAQDEVANLVLYEIVEPHICKITFNRPHRGNAILVPDMNELLATYLEKAQDDDDIKVVILGGAGKPVAVRKKRPAHAFDSPWEVCVEIF